MTDPLDSPPADYGSDRYDYVEIIGAPEGELPKGLQWYEELIAAPCMDCRANVFVYWRTDEQVAKGVERGGSTSRWSYRIAHDSHCPMLRKIEEGS